MILVKSMLSELQWTGVQVPLQLVKHATPDLRVKSSRPTLGVEFAALQCRDRLSVKWKLGQLSNTLQDLSTMTPSTFGLDNSLLGGFILCVLRCLAASLGSTH